MPELMDVLAKSEMSVLGNLDITVPTGSWTLMNAWDQVDLNRGAAITPDLPTSSFTVQETGPYSVGLILNCAFDRTEEIMCGFSVNGADPAKWLQEQGRGANKPIDFQWYGIHNLNAGDVVTVMMQMEATETEVSILSGTFTIAKEF